MVFYFATGKPDDPQDIIESLRAAGAQSEIKRAREIMESKAFNCGFTYSNKQNQAAVTYIGPTTSAAQFLNTWSHELRHIADVVTDSENGEPPAYLTGDICEKLKDIICAFLCDKCRKNL